MFDEARPRRSPTRYLAPLALAVIAIATYLTVQSGLDGGSTSKPSGHVSRRSSARPEHHASGRKVSSQPTYYTVKPGDSLSVISARTGVPLPAIETLNPGVSSNSLQVGQRLRLRR